MRIDYYIKDSTGWQLVSKELFGAATQSKVDKRDGVVVSRIYTDEINVTLSSGYSQRFWIDLSDEQAIERCLKMKELGL